MRGFRTRAATLAAVALGGMLTFSPPAHGDPTTSVSASIARFDAALGAYEGARVTYLGKRQPVLRDWKVLSALFLISSGNLTQTKSNIRNQLRIDVAAAKKAYAAAIRGTKSPTVKAAALDARNSAIAAAAAQHDSALGSLHSIPSMPPRPSK